MKFKKALVKFGLCCCAVSLVACSSNTPTDADYEKWALENGYVKAGEESDAISSATLDGTTSLAFGTITLLQDEMALLVKEMAAGPFTWGDSLTTGNGTVRSLGSLSNTPKYRDMYVLGTTYNNVPNASTAEFVMDADNFKFYGQSESETSKMQDIKVYPDVTLTYVTQMDEAKAAMIGDYGFLHGFIVYGKAHIYTVDDLNPSNAAEGYDHSASEEAVVRYMDVYMPSYYPSRWDFPVVDPNLDYDYTQDPDYAAKVETSAKLIGESAMTYCYEIEPERITISYFSTYSPGAITETAAWSTYLKYADKEEVFAADKKTLSEVKYTGYDLNKYVEARTDDGTGPKCAIYYWEDDGTNPDWVNRYNSTFTYFRESIIDTVGTIKTRWLAEPGTEEVIANKSGLDDELTFVRYVSNVEKITNSATGAEEFKILTAEEIAGLTQGVEYHTETITLPNYSKLLLVSDKTACGIFSQSNLLFKDTASLDKTDHEQQEVEGENDGTFTYEALSDGSYAVTGFIGTSGNVTIPAEYNGKAVTKIAAGAFKENTVIATLTLPDTIVEIGDEAFYRLRKVRQLELPASVITIGKAAFFEMGYGTQGGSKSETYVIFSQYTPEGIEQNHMLGEGIDVSSMQVRIKVPTGATEAFAEAWSEYKDFVTETINQ